MRNSIRVAVVMSLFATLVPSLSAAAAPSGATPPANPVSVELARRAQHVPSNGANPSAHHGSAASFATSASTDAGGIVDPTSRALLPPALATPETVSQWQLAGVKGKVKVGVIDFFSATRLNSQKLSGFAPAIPLTQRFCRFRGVSCTLGSVSSNRHGNAMVEIIHHRAPGATLYLAEVGTASDYRAAIDWFASNGVKVVNHSLIGPYDGPGDGTGTSAAIVDYAVSKGLAWFNSAGDAGVDPLFTDYRGGYWRGTWNDPDHDGWLNFKGSDETLGAFCGALLGLRWSDWGPGRTDYELWIGDMTLSTLTDGAAGLASNRNQATGHALPLEGNDFRWLCNTNAADGPVYDKNGDHLVYLKVRRSSRSTAASSIGDRMELQVINGWFEYSMNAGAAAVGFADSKNPGEATIGHRDSYSSQGPTNDRRIKPDLTTDGCQYTSVYGSCNTDSRFLSADTSSAVATATAALALDGLGPMTPAQLMQFLKSNGTIDSTLVTTTPVPLPNNQWGYGELQLRGRGPMQQPTPGTRYVSKMRHVLDTRVPNKVRAGTAPVRRNGSLVVSFDDGTSSTYNVHRLVALNVTTTGTLGAGTVQVGAADWTVPGRTTSMTIHAAGETQSSFMIVPIGESSDIIVNTTAGGHFIIDQMGVFVAGPSVGSGFHAVNPYRVYDTRTAGAPLAARTPRDIKITGTLADEPTLKVPPGATSVALAITADAPSAAGWATVVGTAAVMPPTITELRFGRATTTTNTVIVPVDSKGKVRLYSTAATHFQVDVLGYFRNLTGGEFHYVPEATVADSRRSSAAPPAAGSLTPIAIPTSVLARAVAVFGRLSTTGAVSKGAFRVAVDGAATGTPQSFRSLAVGKVGQNVALGTFTAIAARNATIASSATAHRRFDLMGWFEPVPFAAPGAFTALPVDPAAPTAFRPSPPKMSPNGRKVVFETTTAGVHGMTVFDRDTKTFTHLDLTTGTGAPNLATIPWAISDDGTRVAFLSTATNVTADGAEVGNDAFLLTTTTGELRRVNEKTDGTRLEVFTSVMIDNAVTRFVYWDPTAFVTDLTTFATTAAPTMPLWTFNPEMTAAWVNPGSVWTSRDNATHTVPAYVGDMATTFLSPDGRYVLYQVNSITTAQVRLFDVDTDTSTLLCSAATFRDIVAAVDWSAGPPVAGNWCNPVSTLDVRVLSAGGMEIGPPSRDGRGLLVANGNPATATIHRAANGEVMLFTNAVNAVAGGKLGVYFYDNPDA